MLKNKLNGILNHKINVDEKSTLCWVCKNSTGGCSWSKEFKEVDGWIAEKTIIRDRTVGDLDSYIVKKCPEFVYDGFCSNCIYFSNSYNKPERFYTICNKYRGDFIKDCKNKRRKK